MYDQSKTDANIELKVLSQQLRVGTFEANSNEECWCQYVAYPMRQKQT
jgi:hypothetical protein